MPSCLANSSRSALNCDSESWEAIALSKPIIASLSFDAELLDCA